VTWSSASFGAWVEEQQDGFFEASWAAQPHEIILFEGEPCSYACVEDRPGDVDLRELLVAPDYQGRGIGSVVLEAVIDHACTRRVPVRLGTHLANRAANCINGWASVRPAPQKRTSFSNGALLTKSRCETTRRAQPLAELASSRNIGLSC
jgi:GNAT superfamily N-acetyltransferase